MLFCLQNLLLVLVTVKRNLFTSWPKTLHMSICNDIQGLSCIIYFITLCPLFLILIAITRTNNVEITLYLYQNSLRRPVLHYSKNLKEDYCRGLNVTGRHQCNFAIKEIAAKPVDIIAILCLLCHQSTPCHQFYVHLVVISKS